MSVFFFYWIIIIFFKGQSWPNWIESRTCNLKVAGSSLRSGRNCRWLKWITSALSTFNTTTEVRPLSKAPNPQLLPGCRSIGCPLCVHYCVCALGWVKCRAQIPSMGHHTWPHVTSLSLSSENMQEKTAQLISSVKSKMKFWYFVMEINETLKTSLADTYKKII